MKIAHLHLDDDLGALIRRGITNEDLACRFEGPQSLKHILESCGIPHTEFGMLCANGSPVTSGYLVQNGDLIEAAGIVPESSSSAEPTFVLDGHLGRLAGYLRMLGLDCLYRRDYDDRELAGIAADDGRILLSRDRRLLMRKAVLDGYLVRSLEPQEQLRQVVHRFGLTKWIKPFRRCMRCNRLLQSVDKHDILDRLEPLTRLYFNDFRICPACGHIYWRGAHFERMQQIIASLGESQAS